ncbi:MAG: hypothetical protein JXA57_15430, partial [Armatimonadetes bacterium]|nr:hypothetical protein [Armatimonadota bacterium]
MAAAERLGENPPAVPVTPAVGVFATCDPRIDEASRRRAQNIVAMTAEKIAAAVVLPGGEPVRVVYSPLLVDGERQADAVARQFKEQGVGILVCAPDTWAFPQLGLLSLLAHFPSDTPLNLTCGNSGPRPGVVFTHAAHGAMAQYGRLVHINVGTWPDTGDTPEMTESTAEALVDWTYAAVTYQALKGRRVVVFGHDSMGMETALAHIIPTRQTFGLEITRLDMKLLADMLAKGVCNSEELTALQQWLEGHLQDRLELRGDDDRARLRKSLAMYLLVRDLMRDLNAVGGGFMSQLEWGSDARGLPLPVADMMESLFNSTFDHNGKKAPLAYATEADVQGLLTMLFFTYLTGGNPPLFMDFRKVWEPWEISRLAESMGLAEVERNASWRTRGFVDGDNSGSASLDWAAEPGASVEEIMSKVSLPLADPGYFPGGGNSVTFVSPAGIRGIAARLAFSAPANMFSLVWDE